MPADLRTLSRIVPIRKLGTGDAQLIARAFDERTVRQGEALWEQGTASPNLGLLIKGRLGVQVDGERVGAVLPGDVIGETSALWASATRSATLRAEEPSIVLLIPVLELQRLAQAFPAFHERLLDRCLEAQAKRIRAGDVHIAKLSRGVLPAPSTSPKGGLASLWKALRKAMGDGSRPSLLPILRDLPGLAEAPVQSLEAISEAFEPYAFDADELLTREGEAGDAVFLLAAGEIQALRHVRNRMAEVLVTFQPGWLFGAVTLAAPGPRTATCRAVTPGWVYRMDHDTSQALDIKARLAWKACMISTLGVQLRNANALLAGFQAGTHEGGPLSEARLQQLLKASGALLGTG